ncbi:MAG: TraL conjugative transposon family protein [Alistipes sp.]|nr:TraL conjugative transposon family protein [Alistipes senegalensis]MCM1250178.1 TraL conjugative transposon family protein [Alistipes sp.]
MIRKKIGTLSERIERFLRRKCEVLPPDRRIRVVLTTLVLFTGLSLYFTVASVRRFGQGTDDGMRIRHIEYLTPLLTEADSVKQSNDFNYDNERKTE